jgi:hypothetical protein
MMISAELGTGLLDKRLPVSVSPVQQLAARGKVEADEGGSSEEFGTRWKLLLNWIGMAPGVDNEELQATMMGKPKGGQNGESEIERSRSGAHVKSGLESSEPIDSSAGDRQALLTASDADASVRRSCSTARHRTPAFAATVGKLGTSGKRVQHASDAEHLGTRKWSKQATPADSLLEHREGIEELAMLNSAPSQHRPISIDATGRAEGETERSFSVAVGFRLDQNADPGPTSYSGAPGARQFVPSAMHSLGDTPEEAASGVRVAADLGGPATTTAAGAGGGLEHPEISGRAAESTSDQHAAESSRSSSSDSVSNAIGAPVGDDAFERRAEYAENQQTSADVSRRPLSTPGDQLSAHPPSSSTHLSARDLLRSVSKNSNGISSKPSSPAAADQGDSILNSFRNPLQNSEGETPGSVRTRTSAESRGQPNTIEALDGSLSIAEPRWIQTGGRRAEAGYQDPSLGWVSVRAEMGSGGVHASVIPSSNDAAQVLNAHLSGLEAHLANSHLSMHPVTISLSQESQVSSGPGDGNQREYGGNTNQNNQQSSSDDRNTTERSKSIRTSLLRSDDQGSRELRVLSTRQLTRGGMYISLMA